MGQKQRISRIMIAVIAGILVLYAFMQVPLHPVKKVQDGINRFLMEKSDAVIKDFLKVHEECWHVLLHGISEEERSFLDQICGRMQQNITEELRKL